MLDNQRVGQKFIQMSISLIARVSRSCSVSQYEPRGPGRPLYQRRISSSSPQPYPDSLDPQDHPTPSYRYPSADLWLGSSGPGPSPAPLHNIPCNGASHLVPHREVLGEFHWPLHVIRKSSVAILQLECVEASGVIHFCTKTAAWCCQNGIYHYIWSYQCHKLVYIANSFTVYFASNNIAYFKIAQYGLFTLNHQGRSLA